MFDLAQLNVWKINDCEYVVAHSREEAVAWYQSEIGEIEDDEIEEVGMGGIVNIAPENHKPLMRPFKDSIAFDIEHGQIPPFIAAYDSHYA